MVVTLAGGMALAGLVSVRRQGASPMRVSVRPQRILADGTDAAIVSIESSGEGKPRVTIVSGPKGAAVESVTGGGGRWEAAVRAGIVPGKIRVAIAMPGARTAAAEIEAVLAERDSLEDGTPDSLRLDSPRDREAFRRWFTFLAEAQYFQPEGARPAEINDCAALIRYCYRETLHIHDAAWTASAQLPLVPAFDSPVKYQYPFTPLGSSLFRVRAGPFHAADLDTNLNPGAFAQFADAQTLWRWNCHFVSRDMAAARAGDLIFFRQSGGASFHSMIYLGESQMRPDGNRYLVYHTGPEGGEKGEIRRPSVAELMHFPRPEWRPLASNPSFLGVYRWNILCPVGTK